MRGAYAICAIDRWSISGAYSICATHNTDRGGASGALLGPTWGPQIIHGAYSLICATNMENMNGASCICATHNPGYFVHDPSGGSHRNIRDAFCGVCAISTKNISGAYF